MPTLVYDLSSSELSDLIRKLDVPDFRARQIWQGLYRQFVNSTEELTSLPSTLRTTLDKDLLFQAFIPLETLKSADRNTEKTLFGLHDGNRIESVLMRYKKRNTLCISSQVGCAMGCVFCA